MKWSLKVQPYRGKFFDPVILCQVRRLRISKRTHISKDELLRVGLCFFSKVPFRIKLVRIRIQLRIPRDSPTRELLIKRLTTNKGDKYPPYVRDEDCSFRNEQICINVVIGDTMAKT